ncbi:biopolymer transport protein ExbD [Novimethylophilus kurashikiensis]|uniref:Biopolymer transport protein ExbD n=1 Tax=Novimethylophilus kurashikiensis TaxID=1825523 RepID=A0A2R5F7I3_9PROT|nr:biopolymer transporter ExbD [Novimethylophilus kurashikiensis]GBG13789.1 biopolymer transport protein ExbD [Novimethylophilus kurashikiensis]
MSMNTAPARPSGEPDLLVDINTTPLIDVMLVLLIMLIITIPIQLHAVNLNLPTDSQTNPPEPPEVVQIEIDDSGAVRWNGVPVSSTSVLDSRFAAAAALPVQPELHVKPNPHAPYRAVAAVMASAQRNNANKIGLVGNEQYQ